MTNSTTQLQPMIGSSAAFQVMREHISRAAAIAKPVLVIGERGTGKELVATRLHYLSPRWEEPLVKLNCASLTETLLESELFGHEAGAFTGANRRHIGRFERAHLGSLFLDELGTIGLRAQEKLLRVVEYGELERVGGSETLQVDARIIAATNVNLQEQVDSALFRADLLDRLAFDVIEVPPLRERREDIIELAEHFALHISAELGRPYFPGFTENVLDELLQQEWPGNVRELKYTIERSIYRASDHEAEISKLFFSPFTHRRSTSTIRSATKNEETKAHKKPILKPNGDFKGQIEALEMSLVQQGLVQSQYSQKKAAEVLGLSYHQLRGYLKKYPQLKP